MGLNLRLVTRLLTVSAIIGLSIWALSGGADLGERAAFVQAFLASVLLFATWSAIDRSDRQIDISLRQIDASDNQTKVIVKQNEDHYLGIDSITWGNFRLFNLSRMPIYIESVHIYKEGMDGAIKIHLDSQTNIIDSSHSINFEVNSYKAEEIKAEIKQYVSNELLYLEIEGLSNPLDEVKMEIAYFYGGTGSDRYSKKYRLMCSMGIYTSDPDSPFKLMAIPESLTRNDAISEGRGVL